MRFLIPLGIFIVMVVFLGIGLKLDPREVPSPLIGKPVPTFKLAQLHAPEQTFAPEDMKGKVWLLNVWASWCVSCRAEHAVLNQFARTGQVEIIGLNYKDEPADAKRWLSQLGNPYKLSVMDVQGMAGLDLGVYGVPETFVIDKKGLVRHKLTGPVDPQNLQAEIIPLLQTLNGEPG